VPVGADAQPDTQPAAEPWHWHAVSPGDWCLGPTPSTTLPTGPVSDFHSFRYLHITSRRLEHLATLGLPLRERHVLEVGAGIGDLTEFFLDRGCRVHTTDGRPLHVAIMRQRYASHPLVTADALDLDPSPPAPPGLFDLVVCYGLLYHVSDPSAVLEFLARACSDLLLLETIAGPGDDEQINPTPEDAALAGAAFTGNGCRPSRAWIYARLRALFPHVYLPITQPNHYEYPVDWTIASPFARRAIFIASRRPLDNPLLTTTLPDRQERH
jgi:SAM-dependent methyltransferase